MSGSLLMPLGNACGGTLFCTDCTVLVNKRLDCTTKAVVRTIGQRHIFVSLWFSKHSFFKTWPLRSDWIWSTETLRRERTYSSEAKAAFGARRAHGICTPRTKKALVCALQRRSFCESSRRRSPCTFFLETAVAALLSSSFFMSSFPAGDNKESNMMGFGGGQWCHAWCSNVCSSWPMPWAHRTLGRMLMVGKQGPYTQTL